MIRVRRLVRSQGLLVAALVLAASVAVAGSAVSLIWRVFVSPLDVERPERLFIVRAVETDGDVEDLFSAVQYQALSERGTLSSFDTNAAVGYQNVDVETTAGRHRAPVAFVSPDFFHVMGRPIRRGRGFLASDFADGGTPVAVLSDFFWRNELQARPDVLGQQMRIGEVRVLVIGIAAPGVIGTRLDIGPAAFLPMPLVRATLPQRTELWPATSHTATKERPLVATDWLTIVVRLRAVDSSVTAEHRLQTAVAERGGSVESPVAQWTLAPLPGTAVPVTSRLELAGSAQLFVTVSIALLVLGAATVALVALRDVETRRSELATRLALGATRSRVVAMVTGQVLVAGLCAVGLAFPLSAAIMATAAGVLLPGGVNVGALGLAFSVPAALAIATTGLVAVAIASALVAMGVLGYTRAGTLSGTRLNQGRMIAPRLRRAVVAVLMSLAIVLLGGAIFAFRAVSRTMTVDVGHDANRILYASFDLRSHRFTEPDARVFVTSLMARSLLSPVITHATVQFRAGGFGDTAFIDRQRQSYPGFFPLFAVDRSYFDVLRLRPVAGRRFIATDVAGQTPVTIISASVAEAIAARNGFGDVSEVVGHTIELAPYGSSSQSFTIVGVVDNWVHDPRDLAGKALYVLADQNPTLPAMIAAGQTGFMTRPTVVLEVEDAGLAKEAILTALHDVAPRVSPFVLSSTQERLQATFSIQHLASRVMSVFSTIAVVLVFVSLHVLVRSIGAAKRQEIAIRSALGANPLRLARWFASEIAKPVVAAVFLGAAGLTLWFYVMSVYVVGIVASDLSIVLAILGAICASALGSAIASGVLASARSPADVLRQE